MYLYVVFIVCIMTEDLHNICVLKNTDRIPWIFFLLLLDLLLLLLLLLLLGLGLWSLLLRCAHVAVLHAT